MSTTKQLRQLSQQLNRVAHQVDGRVILLAEAILGEEEGKAACEGCLDMLPSYVDAEFIGQPMTGELRAIWRHLRLCADCSWLYAELLEVALLDEKGALPVVDSYPQPDLSFLRTVRKDED
jgi:hypothetical protein